MKSLIGLSILVCVLAFSFQGTRGVWEPDEGYYIGISKSMVETGDWIVPQLNLRPFLDKPPVVYWGSALVMKWFGFNEWAARTPHALWFLFTTALVGLFGQTLWDKQTGYLSALFYMTTPVPLVAAHVVTPDTPLTFWVTAGVFCFWNTFSSRSSGGQWLWASLLGVSLGFGVLSKGPATLVFMAPMILFLFLTKSFFKVCFRLSTLASIILFVGIGGSWYIAVVYFIPGAGDYFFDNQVFGRVISHKYNRNPNWYAFLYIYFPVLLFGTLPWSVFWYRPLYQKLRTFRGNAHSIFHCADQRLLFLLLMVAVPFIVFSAASSKLPLYILPTFPALCILSARCWQARIPALCTGPLTLRRLAPVAVWCLILISVKAGMAYYPSERDTRAFWNSIKEHLPPGRHEIVILNQRRRGLSFYTDSAVEMVTTREDPYPTFSPPEPLTHEVHELTSCRHSHLFIVREKDYEKTSKLIEGKGFTFYEEAGPYGTKLLITPPAPTEDHVVRLAAMGDTRSGKPGKTQLGSALYEADETEPLDGIILLGDNLSFEGDPAYFESRFFKPYRSLHQAGVPFYASLGNHDVRGGHASFQLTHPYFNMNGRRYYTESFGDGFVQCFILDTTTIAGDPRQTAWLNRQLSESRAKWKVIAMHVPIRGGIRKRPKPDENLRTRLEPIFVKGGVDIVLAGHNHVYQRYLPRLGIQHFTAGSGGKLDRGEIMDEDPELVVGNDEVNVALILKFTENQCRFTAINPLGEAIDEGVINKDTTQNDSIDDENQFEPHTRSEI